MAFSFGNFNLNLTKLNEFAMPFSMKKIKQGQNNDILVGATPTKPNQFSLK